MSRLPLAGWQPLLTAFVIWFAHFMACWAVVEIWPGQWRANVLAWIFTVLALVAMGMHSRRLAASRPEDELTTLTRNFARGAIAIATVAVIFNLLPSLVHLPHVP